MVTLIDQSQKYEMGAFRISAIDIARRAEKIRGYDRGSMKATEFSTLSHFVHTIKLAFVVKARF